MNNTNNKKKWNILTESKSSLLFVLTSLVQAIVLTYLQSRIFVRNVHGWLNLHPELKKNDAADTCLNSTSFASFMLLTFENVMFIFLYLFEFYFCINAVLHKNTIHIFTIVLTNVFNVILGVLQLFEARETNNQFLNDCPTIVFDPEFMIREVPNIVMITFLALVVGYLSFKLYQQFGWSIYKKIGDDIQMQLRYKTRLIFLMLLKVNLLMMLLFSILIMPFSINSNDVNKVLVYVDFAFFISLFLFEAFVHKSIENESKRGMISFLTFWVMVLGVYGWFCYIGLSLAFTYKMYIGFIFSICFLSFGLSTFAIGISVTKNFGKGLKEYLDKSEGKTIDEEYEQNENNNNSNNENNENNKV